MNISTIVVEDYFENPDEIREIALDTFTRISENLINDPRRHYPGVRSNHLGVIQPEIHLQIKNFIEDLISQKLPTFSSYFHVTTGIHGRGLCHSDPNNIAGLIYLNPDPPQDSGTRIVDAWNGYDFTYTDEEQQSFWNSCVSHDFDEIQKFNKMKEEVNEAYFKTSVTVENRYNRMIVYNAKKHHAPEKYFGHNLHTARLSIVFFGFYDYQANFLTF